MIKLKKIIERKRVNSKLRANDPVTYNGIAKILGIPYKSVVSKCNKGTFTVEEGLYLFQLFYPKQWRRFCNIPEFEEFCQLFMECEE